MELQPERIIKHLIAVVIIGAAVFFGYRYFAQWHHEKIDSAIEEERQLWKIKAEVLQEEVARLQSKLEDEREALVPEKKFFEVFGDNAQPAYPERIGIECKELERQIKAFFAYLDKKDYIDALQLKSGTLKLFQDMGARISETLPVNTGETRDILTLMRNMAHFYRILGKTGIQLIKEILENEADIMEPTMAAFFAYFSPDNDCRDNMLGPPSAEVFYAYSGFFLNTLAGRSYVFRRDSNTRALVSYYSVLFLDRANDEKINSHGIDIRPYIDFSMFDIVDRKGLVYRKQYLAKLMELKEKYQL